MPRLENSCERHQPSAAVVASGRFMAISTGLSIFLHKLIFRFTAQGAMRRSHGCLDGRLAASDGDAVGFQAVILSCKVFLVQYR